MIAAEQYIAVHVGRSDMQVPLIRANWMGSLLLGQLLHNALVQAYVSEQESPTWTGPLDDFIMKIEVSDADAAVQIVRTELEKAVLLNVSQIAVWDSDCEQWSCVYPRPDVRMNWLLDSDRLELAFSQYQEQRKLEAQLPWSGRLLLKVLNPFTRPVAGIHWAWNTWKRRLQANRK